MNTVPLHITSFPGTLRVSSHFVCTRLLQIVINVSNGTIPLALQRRRRKDTALLRLPAAAAESEARGSHRFRARHSGRGRVSLALVKPRLLPERLVVQVCSPSRLGDPALWFILVLGVERITFYPLPWLTSTPRACRPSSCSARIRSSSRSTYRALATSCSST